ncbi:alpha-2-antiplasmin [Thamnophis elegans]|uniref:alpha-2-antiplasmin n=1 Tax=Thamnophis elegans TaxID=35005 RepID=UPI00137685C7|nr:alpha-2-antiplasmin [Thamnophis elegans]
MNPLLCFPMALLLWPLLAACLPALSAGQDQATFVPDVGWDDGAQRNTLLVPAVEVPSEDDRLPQAGTEPQGALQDPTKSPHFPDEAAIPGEVVPDGSKELGDLPNSLEQEEEEEEGCQDQALSGSVDQIASAMRALGVDLLREMEAEDSTGNTIFSPLSIGLALAHLALGAANQTQKRLLEVLHMESVPCLHQALRGITQHLHQTALSIAGRLFLEKGFPVKEKFLEASQRFYGATPALLSGNNRADLETINRWVEEATNGQISTMLTQLPPNIVMVLLNAVYFQGFWKTKFNPLLTEPSLFHLDEDSAVSVEMMKERDFPLSWFRTESWEAEVAKFPFKGNTSFVAIVPRLHLRKNFSQLLSEVLQLGLEASFPKERPTMVKMPKLHLEDHVDLNGALTRLGLGELFSAPDLHHIAEGPLVVSSIQHRAALELAEAGVQAAAATSVVASRSFSAFSLDQPFILMITEDVTGIPLFLGTIRNPSPGAPRQKTGQDPLGEKEGPPLDHERRLWKP